MDAYFGAWPMTQPMTPREKVDLKPCPFCGGETISTDSQEMNEGPAYFWHKCEECGAETKGDYGEVAATSMWNRRAALASGSGDPDLQKMHFAGGDHAELARLAEAAAKRAPGLWGSDVEKGEGEYGSGDDDRTGFMVPYMETEHGKRLFDAHYCDVAEVHENYDIDDDGDYSIYAWDQAAKEIFDFLSAVQPSAVLALIAEIAALRGERDRNWEEYLAERQSRMEHGSREAGYLDQIGRLNSRATEAERKLAEARTIIEEGLYARTDKFEAMARTFISSTEAERG